MRALTIAATGMSAQVKNIEVIANNVANINTTGFKRARAEFTDLIYQSERLMGVASRGRDATVPEGVQIGLGVRTAAIRTVHNQGTIANTGNSFDLALTGCGWFQVNSPQGDILYSRDGAFNTNGAGQLVTTDGYTLAPPILVPPGASAISKSIGRGDGDHSRQADASEPRSADNCELRQRGRTAAIRKQPVSADGCVWPSKRRRAWRQRIWRDSARLSRGIECGSRFRDHEYDCGAEGL